MVDALRKTCIPLFTRAACQLFLTMACTLGLRGLGLRGQTESLVIFRNTKGPLPDYTTLAMTRQEHRHEHTFGTFGATHSLRWLLDKRLQSWYI